MIFMEGVRAVNTIVECNIKIDPPWLIITPVGYFAEALGKKLTEGVKAVNLDGLKYVIFDFSQAPVVNSNGLAALIDVCESLQDTYHLDIGFCKMSNLVLEAFQIAGMNQLGTFFATVDEAKSFFGS